MNILVLLTDGFGARGGIGDYNRKLMTALQAAGHRVVAVARGAPSDAIESLPHGIEQHAIGGGRLAYVAAAMGHAYREKYDLVLCLHVHLLAVALLLAKLGRVPCWLQIYGIDVWQGSQWRALLIRQLEHVISISDFTARKFANWSGYSPADLTLVAPAYSSEEYQGGPADPGLKASLGLSDARILLTVGRLAASEAYKGQDRIIEVMPQLLRHVANLTYLIAGEGDDRPRLEALARDRGVAEHVQFAGYVPREQLAAFYRLSDVMILCGHGEGFGIVLLEAMACGTPVIGSVHDGSREAVLDGRLGAVADPDNESELVSAILKALETPQVDHQLLEESFGVHRFNRAIRELFAGSGDALNEANRPRIAKARVTS